MKEPTRAEQEAARAAAEVARRAIRRLDILEWVILAGAAGIAAAGGWGVAWLTVPPGSPYFRVTWIVSALLLIVIPGVIVMAKNRREERVVDDGSLPNLREDDG